MTYEIRLTRLAATIAETRYSADAVVDAARKELDEFLNDQVHDDMFMHCFAMPGSTELEFICVPDKRGGVRVDTFTYEEGEVLTKGPFKGKRIAMPKPDSDPD